MLSGNLGKNHRKSSPKNQLRLSQKRGGGIFWICFYRRVFCWDLQDISDLRSRLILFRVSKFARIWCRKCMFIYTKSTYKRFESVFVDTCIQANKGVIYSEYWDKAPHTRNPIMEAALWPCDNSLSLPFRNLDRLIPKFVSDTVCVFVTIPFPRYDL